MSRLTRTYTTESREFLDARGASKRRLVPALLAREGKLVSIHPELMTMPHEEVITFLEVIGWEPAPFQQDLVYADADGPPIDRIGVRPRRVR